MDALNDLIKSFVTQSQKILGDNLIGVYLHGSAVMGCYNEKKSDIDLLVVVNEAIPNNIKHRFMDMVVELNTYAPPKGIELSIVKKGVCNPFVYPTPFELHFSIAHLEWYKTNPLDYIDKMKGIVLVDPSNIFYTISNPARKAKGFGTKSFFLNKRHRFWQNRK